MRIFSVNTVSHKIYPECQRGGGGGGGWGDFD